MSKPNYWINEYTMPGDRAVAAHFSEEEARRLGKHADRIAVPVYEHPTDVEALKRDAALKRSYEDECVDLRAKFGALGQRIAELEAERETCLGALKKQTEELTEAREVAESQKRWAQQEREALQQVDTLLRGSKVDSTGCGTRFHVLRRLIREHEDLKHNAESTESDLLVVKAAQVEANKRYWESQKEISDWKARAEKAELERQESSDSADFWSKRAEKAEAELDTLKSRISLIEAGLPHYDNNGRPWVSTPMRPTKRRVRWEDSKAKQWLDANGGYCFSSIDRPGQFYVFIGNGSGEHGPTRIAATNALRRKVEGSK